MMTLLPGIDRDPVEIPSLAKQESSVRHLQLLYTIVAGLALSDAIGALFGEQAADDASAWQLLPLLIAFVVTLIPFFHAALRHLDDAYLIDPTAHQVKRGALAADFLFLFFEGCLLFALAHRLEAERVFLGLFSVLLVVDIVWAITFHLASPSSRRKAAELQLLFLSRKQNLVFQLKWAANNLVFLLIVGLFVLVDHQFLHLGPAGTRIVIMLVAIARAASDYAVSWPFYFPPPSDGEDRTGGWPEREGRVVVVEGRRPSKN